MNKENKEVTILDVIGKVMTHNVEITEEDYKAMLKQIAGNYDLINKEEKTKMPSLRERRKRIQSNYYGQSINMLFQVISTQTALIEQFNSLSLLVEAIADKVGVEFEKLETEEEKAMRAANEYLSAGAELRREQLKQEKAKIVPFKK